ncbi:MAG: LptF/LptG family permease [Nitrospinae bacterium]|nr:LptF/LptG family permease [Nitrospinota bacterium]
MAGIALLALIVLVLLQQTMRLADLITMQGASLAAVAQILLLALPALVVIILPVLALMTPVMTYSRLATASELLALKATGYSFYRLLAPVFGMAILTAGSTATLILGVIPHTNFLARKQMFEAVSTALHLRIHARVFQSPMPGLVLYVERVDSKDGRLRDVFISDSRAPEVTTILAEEAEIVPDFAGMRVIVELRNGSLQRKEGDGSFQRAAFERYSFVLEFGNPWDEVGLSKRRVREMTLSEMWQEAEALKVSGGNYLRPLVELHKRMALPVACFVLGFVGAPIGSLNRRTGRLGGFAISAGALLLFYILVTSGGSLAETGTVSPALGVWAPNALAALCAVYLVLRVNGTRPSTPINWLGTMHKKLRLPKSEV